MLKEFKWHIFNMHKNNKNKNTNQGFTIVEVMIVLAVAGLILAVVFVAVPGLQRNTRNNARKDDIARLRTQLDISTSNNGGRLPDKNVFVAALKAEEMNYVGLNAAGTALTTVPSDNGSAAVSVAANTLYFLNAIDLAQTLLWPETAENSAILVPGYKCSANSFSLPTAASKWDGTTNAATGVVDTKIIEKAQRTSVAVLYKLEAENVLYCSSDTN